MKPVIWSSAGFMAKTACFFVAEAARGDDPIADNPQNLEPHKLRGKNSQPRAKDSRGKPDQTRGRNSKVPQLPAAKKLLERFSMQFLHKAFVKKLLRFVAGSTRELKITVFFLTPVKETTFFLKKTSKPVVASKQRKS